MLWRLSPMGSPQYKKAWYASFPPQLWPPTVMETSDGKLLLQLKDGTTIVAIEPADSDIATAKETDHAGTGGKIVDMSQAHYVPRWIREIYGFDDPRSEAIERELLEGLPGLE
jgi:hypothetical protein